MSLQHCPVLLTEEVVYLNLVGDQFTGRRRQEEESHVHSITTLQSTLPTIFIPRNMAGGTVERERNEALSDGSLAIANCHPRPLLCFCAAQALDSGLSSHNLKETNKIVIEKRKEKHVSRHPRGPSVLGEKDLRCIL